MRSLSTVCYLPPKWGLPAEVRFDIRSTRYLGRSNNISPTEIEAAREHIGVVLTQQPR
jgi:hypothetical protein